MAHSKKTAVHKSGWAATWADRLRGLLLKGTGSGVSISHVEPVAGLRGSLLTVYGSGFSPVRGENKVEVGGKPACVAFASDTELRLIVSDDADTGPICVSVAGRAATARHNFTLLSAALLTANGDGPPISYIGSGHLTTPGPLNPVGPLRLLVALVKSNDMTEAATDRPNIVQNWDTVKTYYAQASYGRCDLQVTVLDNWIATDGKFTDHTSSDGSLVTNPEKNRVMAFAALSAINEGHDLNSFDCMAVILVDPGRAMRGQGSMPMSHFAYDDGQPWGTPGRTSIATTTWHALEVLIAGTASDWGRLAHELGHSLVSAPWQFAEGSATLGEDIYNSDLIDSSAATAERFDMMGFSDDRPLFSGYHLDKLGYYLPPNIKRISWNRFVFSEEFVIVAHGLAQNAISTRCHLVEIVLSNGLSYYVQVRGRPGTTAQIFDANIPLPPVLTAPDAGGVIVTSAVTGTINNNQQTRFLSLLHAPRVLMQGESAVDPDRELKITVLDDNISASPRVCRVRIEWALAVTDNPDGQFDLSIAPWDSNYQSPDIWVDAPPFVTGGAATDPNERPLVRSVNQLTARISNSGIQTATDVDVTFYSIYPPSIGDNGNWSPMQTVRIPAIATGTAQLATCNWTPLIGLHTCLKVAINQQPGEVTGSNNQAQENIFDFQLEASSPPEAVFIRTAVRNPLATPTTVIVTITGVPDGYRVYFPHSWVRLEAHASREFDLIVIPTQDYEDYRGNKVPAVANIKANGWIERNYEALCPPNNLRPASRYYPIGGTLNRVHVVKRVTVSLKEEATPHPNREIALRGAISPTFANQTLLIELVDQLGRTTLATAITNATGTFNTSIPIVHAAGPARRGGRIRTVVAASPRHFRAQASITGADAVASGTSPYLYIDR